MAAVETPLAEVRNVAGRSAAPAAEVPVVIDGYVSVPEDPDGRDVIAHVAQSLAGFAAPQAEKVAAEIAVTIKTGPAAPPIAAVPIAARRPIGAGFRFPPTAAGSSRSFKAADDENGATATFHPEALPVDTPGLSFNAGGTADLLLHSDFTWAIASAVFAVVIVGFTLESLLRKANGRKHEHGKR